MKHSILAHKSLKQVTVAIIRCLQNMLNLECSFSTNIGIQFSTVGIWIPNYFGIWMIKKRLVQGKALLSNALKMAFIIYNRHDVIITSQMSVRQISLTVAVNQNVWSLLFFVWSRYDVGNTEQRAPG